MSDAPSALAGMAGPRQPKYQWGQRVWALVDLNNDGSYPDEDADALLAATGDMGEIVQVGVHEESGIPVYLVEFPLQRVVGCFEEELSPEPAEAAES